MHITTKSTALEWGISLYVTNATALITNEGTVSLANLIPNELWLIPVHYASQPIVDTHSLATTNPTVCASSDPDSATYTMETESEDWELTTNPRKGDTAIVGMAMIPSLLLGSKGMRYNAKRPTNKPIEYKKTTASVQSCLSPMLPEGQEYVERRESDWESPEPQHAGQGSEQDCIEVPRRPIRKSLSGVTGDYSRESVMLNDEEIANYGSLSLCAVYFDKGGYCQRYDGPTCDGLEDTGKDKYWPGGRYDS
ncbi:hypothetical protein FA15DRAFT_658297 [Coprinopsis marcescibilis]|uniref:Uncharacterized protein n=1 Tax=Coprinopsis marcescibilis TaxID=230819 RepID=A0A5C3KMI2_COPMA|nr:hypothetical protein FA15DRAFT_658297 [Coprinopsis marcescibilis]